MIELFSITMPLEGYEIIEKFINKPMIILLKHNEILHENIKYFYVEFDEEEMKF